LMFTSSTLTGLDLRLIRPITFMSAY
jgi:hypothetical protein